MTRLALLLALAACTASPPADCPARISAAWVTPTAAGATRATCIMEIEDDQ